jgi:hypothetical protein
MRARRLMQASHHERREIRKLSPDYPREGLVEKMPPTQAKGPYLRGPAAGLSPLQSQCGDTVEANGLWQAFDETWFAQGAIGVDAVDADGTCARVERVEEFAVAADGHIKINRACGVGSDNRLADRSEGTVGADREAGDRGTCGVVGVDELAIRSDGVPAVTVTKSTKALADRGNGAVGVDGVGGNAGNIGTVRLVFRDNQAAIRCEDNTKDTGGYALIDDHRPKGSVRVDGKCVDVFGILLDNYESVAIRADRDGSAAGVRGGEKRSGVGNLGEVTEAIGAEGYDSSISARIEDVDCAFVFGDRDGESAASGFLIDEDGQTAWEIEAGDGAAACVDSEQQVVVTTESERTLRLQWIGGTSASAAASSKAPSRSETAIIETLISEYLVSDSVIRHHEDG